MRAAEHRYRRKIPTGRAGKTGGWVASKTPKASALKLHHPDMAKSKSKAESKTKTPKQRCLRVLGLPISYGASPRSVAKRAATRWRPMAVRAPGRGLVVCVVRRVITERLQARAGPPREIKKGG
jgi:hypothetical protein